MSKKNRPGKKSTLRSEAEIRAVMEVFRTAFRTQLNVPGRAMELHILIPLAQMYSVLIWVVGEKSPDDQLGFDNVIQKLRSDLADMG